MGRQGDEMAVMAGGGGGESVQLDGGHIIHTTTNKDEGGDWTQGWERSEGREESE